MRLPGVGTFPNVDDHLVEPEITRDEIIGGRRVVALPREAPYADQLAQLSFVLSAHAVPKYRVSRDLLTRFAEDSDFASDICIRKEGSDPVTGVRHLEEVAFFVVSPENERLVGKKAELMSLRGVLRIFSVRVHSREIREWNHGSQGWCAAATLRIEDPCLVVPLEAAALFDAEEADRAVLKALAAKGNPVILRREASAKAAGKEEGRAEGVAQSVLEVLAARQIETSEAQRKQILSCQDLEQLGLWLQRAVVAASSTEVLAEPTQAFSLG